MYWVVFGVFSVSEQFLDVVLSWCAAELRSICLTFLVGLQLQDPDVLPDEIGLPALVLPAQVQCQLKLFFARLVFTCDAGCNHHFRDDRQAAD